MKIRFLLILPVLLSASLFAADSLPTFEFVGITNGVSGSRFAVLSLSNSTERAIEFVGPNFHMPQQVYTPEAQKEWTDLPKGICQDDWHPETLAPNESTILLAYPRSNLAWRVCVTVWSGTITNRLCSEKIELLPNNAVERTRLTPRRSP